MLYALTSVVRNQVWAIGTLAVIVCATFAARAASYVVESETLDESTPAPVVRVVPPPPAPARDKDGQSLANRNMWCSSCGPEVRDERTAPSLPLALIATSVGVIESASFATVVHTESHKQGSYAIGDRLPGATGSITAIKHQFVEYTHEGRTERLLLAVRPMVHALAQSAPAGDTGDVLLAGIRKIDETTFEIDKRLVDQALNDPMSIAKGVRVVPSNKGVRLYAIRPGSLFATLGLTSGDTLSSINGMELTTAAKALEAYTKLRGATSLELEVIRRGKPITLEYSIR